MKGNSVAAATSTAGSNSVLKCFACSETIREHTYFKLLDRTWHSSCVKCTTCGVQLPSKCYTRDGGLYLFCQHHFNSDAFSRCSGCSQRIAPEELVQRIHDYIFHLSCLTCCSCNQHLQTGDNIYIITGAPCRVFCTTHYRSQVAANGGVMKLMPSAGGEWPAPTPVHYNPNAHFSDPTASQVHAYSYPQQQHGVVYPGHQQGMPQQHHPGSHPQQQQLLCAPGSAVPPPVQHSGNPLSSISQNVVSQPSPATVSNHDSNSSDFLFSADSSRPTGNSLPPHATFSQAAGAQLQLEDEKMSDNLSVCSTENDNISSPKPMGSNNNTRKPLKREIAEHLRAYFDKNSKPTKPEREELANQLGITERVIQIWFQNRRSKDRRVAGIASGSPRPLSPASTDGNSNSMPHSIAQNENYFMPHSNSMLMEQDQTAIITPSHLT